MFSKQLILKAVDALPQKSHNELDQEIINLDLDSKEIDLTGSIFDKKRAIQGYLLANPEAKDNYGDSIVLRMMNSTVKNMLICVEREQDEFDEESLEFKSDRNFYRYLRLDGYDIDFNKRCIIEDIANYTQVAEKNDELIASKTFANIAKVANGDEIYINSKDEKIKRTLKVDETLNGTIAILKVKNSDDIFNGYRYKQVKIEKVEA